MISLKQALKRDLIHGYSVASHSRCRSFTVNQAPQRSSTKFCAVFPVWSKVFKLSRNLSIIRQAKILWTVCLFYKLRKKMQDQCVFCSQVYSKQNVDAFMSWTDCGRARCRVQIQNKNEKNCQNDLILIWFWKNQKKVQILFSNEQDISRYQLYQTYI